jgi:hypothetical protein
LQGSFSADRVRKLRPLLALERDAGTREERKCQGFGEVVISAASGGVIAGV